jgi:hypothetical protein
MDLKVIGFVIVMIILVALIPLGVIVSLNNLFVGVIFTSAIPITIWTYLSMLFLELTIFSHYSSKIGE